MYVYMCIQCPSRLKGGIRVAGTRLQQLGTFVKYLEWKPVPPQEQAVLLTNQASLQPLEFAVLKILFRCFFFFLELHVAQAAPELTP